MLLKYRDSEETNNGFGRFGVAPSLKYSVEIVGLEKEERYPSVPRPFVVLVILSVSPTVDTKFAEPRPVTVEASSFGSMKLVI